jgi:hypothetical protein
MIPESDSDHECGTDHECKSKGLPSVEMIPESDSVHEGGTDHECKFKGLPSVEMIPDEDCDSTMSEEIPQVPDARQVLVQLPVKTATGRRSDKEHACVYCSKLYPKLPRHFEDKHENETEVVKALNLPVGSKERNQALSVLRKRGDFNHNFKVLEKRCGVLIPKYRSRQGEEKAASEYVPCQFCYASYIKTDLWKHQNKCSEKPKGKIGDLHPIANGKLLLPCETGTLLKSSVLGKMKDDDVKLKIEGDSLIKEFGDRLLEKHGSDPQNYYYISQKLRELGRLLLAMKVVDSSIVTLEDCMLPANWNKLIAALHRVSGFITKTGMYTIPSLALKLGHSLKKCARLMRTDANITEKKLKRKRAASFIELYEDEWAERVSSKALASLHRMSFNRPQLLPLVADVVCLHKYVELELEKLQEAIKSDPAKNYAVFLNLCLTQLILFNRKRCGEAQRIKLSDFSNGLKSDKVVDDVILQSLSAFEVKLCETHRRFEIMGKMKKKVPVILTAAMLGNLTMLVEARSHVSVGSDHLFGRINSVHPYRGNDALRGHSHACGAKYPELLTSTKLRKQLATLSQVLNLKENSQDMLARFLGHNIRVHRDYYRLPQSTLEVAKVGKVLHAINSGRIATFKDMDLDAMNIDNTGDCFSI